MKSPAFRFYPSDFVASPGVQAMDLEEVGAYVFLLCNAWLSDKHGYLPDNDDRLRRLAHMTPEQWDRSKVLLLSKFPPVEEGWRANIRMVHEAEKQVKYSESQSEKGKLGGRGNKATRKLELSGEKTGVSQNESPEKPSASVFDSASVSGSDTVFDTREEGEGAHLPHSLPLSFEKTDGQERVKRSLSRGAKTRLGQAKTVAMELAYVSNNTVAFTDREKRRIATLLADGYTQAEIVSALRTFLEGKDTDNLKDMGFAARNFVETADQLINTARRKKQERAEEQARVAAGKLRIVEIAEREMEEQQRLRAAEEAQVEEALSAD